MTTIEPIDQLRKALQRKIRRIVTLKRAGNDMSKVSKYLLNEIEELNHGYAWESDLREAMEAWDKLSPPLGSEEL